MYIFGASLNFMCVEIVCTSWFEVWFYLTSPSTLCESSRGICFKFPVWETWSCLDKFVIVC